MACRLRRTASFSTARSDRLAMQLLTNIGSARLLREGDADDFVVFLGGQCSEGFSPQFLSWRGKDGRVAVPFGRSRVCWVNLAIGAGRMRSRTHTPRSADPVNARR